MRFLIAAGLAQSVEGSIPGAGKIFRVLVLFGKVLAASNKQPRVLMASLFGFGRNMLRF